MDEFSINDPTKKQEPPVGDKARLGGQIYIVHKQKADGREEIFCVKVDKSTANVLPRAREK